MVNLTKTKAALLIFTLLVGLFSQFLIKPATALSGNEFQAGRIIDDSIFSNPHSMDAGDIQYFLNAKVPNCDTYGTQPYAGTTRATYGSSRGYPPPYICLKDYAMNVGQVNADAYCTGINAGGKSAATIIKEVSLSCSINPKVILVLLQKEQSLVTDDWPWSVQYQKATGYGCPDTASCDPQYAGFFNQVYYAARQFKKYAANPQQYNFQARTNRNIYWHPNAACGYKTVFIDNQATAGLYNYTPYQPNQAALNNLYGEGDGCSSYGNRNFWRLFNDWFGPSIVGVCSPNEQPYAEVMRSYNHANYKHFYTAYPCEINSLNGLGYSYEGVAFYQTAANSPYAVVVHRLYNPNTQLHLWTTTQEEINAATQFGGYRYEGVAFYAVNSQVPRLVIVHRLYNPQTYLHLWTTTQEEINAATQFGGYRYEGVAFYAAPPPM